MRSSNARRAACAAIALAVLAVAVPAAAAPSPADVESARALYVLGKELRDRGDLAESFEHFRAAHALVATPITALELGRAYALLGKPLEARAVLSGIERMPVAPDESKKAAASREEARAFGEELAALIPSLLVKIECPAGAEPVVTIDGARIAREALAVPRKVNPGRHTIVASVGETQRKEEVTLDERESRTVSFDLRGAAATASHTSRSESNAGASASHRGPWLTIALGAAATSAVVGAGSGVFAWTMAGDLKDSCVDGRCPPEVHDELSQVKTASAISTVAFVVTAVALAAAAGIWIAEPKRASSGQPRGALARW